MQSIEAEALHRLRPGKTKLKTPNTSPRRTASGPVEGAIRERITEGSVLDTPSGTATFEVETISSECIVLLLGKGRHRTPIPWECLEGVPAFVEGQGKVRISGTGYSSDVDPNSLDGYLKHFVSRATAGWVAALLEKAGVLEIDRSERPASVKLAREARH